jgi:hypothetical protein
LFRSFPPVTHAFSGSVEVTRRDRLAFIADGVHRNDSAILHEKPQHAGIELAYMT